MGINGLVSMDALKVHKVVASLPAVLDKNALYLVRTGEGFDLYATDATGAHAHRLNSTGGTDGRMREYVQSRGTGLVTNGSAFLRDNTNFSRFAYDPTDLYAGFGCFTTSQANADFSADETLPINPQAQYEWTFAAKTTVKRGTPMAYAYLAAADADGQAISPDCLARVSFRVTAAAGAGAAALQVHPDDTAKLALYMDVYKTANTPVYLNSYRYTAAGGYPYEPGTYSRNRLTDGSARASALRLTGNTLTGFAIASGKRIEAGDTVSLAQADSTYLYPFMTTATRWSANRDLVNHEIPTQWTEYHLRFKFSEVLAGLRVSHGRLADTSAYPNLGASIAKATAVLRIGWLLNRSAQAGNTTALSAVNFREI